MFSLKSRLTFQVLLSFGPSFKRVASFGAGNIASNKIGISPYSSPPTTLSSSKMASDYESPSVNNEKKLRVLALHGSEGNGFEFSQRLQVLQEELLESEGIEIEITALDAPFSKGGGFAWWTMPPGVRSFSAEAYEGFDISASKVLEFWEPSSSTQQQQLLPLFDLVVGHSQGSILIAALLALGQTPYHPTKGYILNGVAWPNPYSEQLKSLQLGAGGDGVLMSSSPSIRSSPPRVLFIMGEKDRINPVTSAEQVREGFKNAGLQVSTVVHPGGHSFPTQRDETMVSITKWILQDSF